MTAHHTLPQAAQAPSHEGNETSSPPSQTIYQPLNEDLTNFRLLKIHPATKASDPISCEVLTIPFARKPKFEALSYRWGHKTAEDVILLNNIETKVGLNLKDGLHYLRDRRPSDRLYWIDALCINQQDIHERNNQVRIMRNIYTRATAVVIWLGQKYVKYESVLPELRSLCHPGKEDRDSSPAPNAEGSASDENHGPATESELESLALAKALYKDKYWDRVWIIQEINLAERLEVCFGNSSVSWAGFVHFMTMHNLGSGGPLKHDYQRKNKYNGYCELLPLLKNYIHAKCEDRKDKVYGLVGLAVDARYFPVDYNKSLIEIWTDVMEFANRRNLFQNEDIVKVGALVKFLLMGDSCEPLEQILRPQGLVKEAANIIDDPKSAKVFHIPGKVLGCVKHTGPRPEDIIADPFKQEAWENTVQFNWRADSSGAHFESDGLLRNILDPEGPDLAMSCFSYTSIVQWQVWESYRSFWDSCNGKIRMLQDTSVAQDAVLEPSESESQARNMRLYQLDCLFGSHDWKMGLASGNIQLGDLICWVESARRALILRPLKGHGSQWTLQAVGTATIAKDIQGVSREEHVKRFKKFDPSNIAHMDISLDSTLIFILLENAAGFSV